MQIKKYFANLLLFIFPLLLLELIFRALPVSYPPYILPVTSKTPIASMQQNQDYLYSKGWDFSIRAKKHSNNFGYINQNNYDPEKNSPLLMVVGDSFVEAQQVDAGKSVAELLGSSINGKRRVYSIGLSGAPLSQYLMFAEYSKRTFHPDAMAFVIVGNDFDESLFKYKSSPRFHYFKEKDGELTLQRVDYEISNAKKILRSSAFIRYVMLNLEVKSILEGILAKKNTRPQEYVGNVPSNVDEQRINNSMNAIDEFLRQLPERSGLDVNKILFVLDGIRPALYSQEAIKKAENSFYTQMKRYFEKQALLLGYEVIDMQPVFIKKNRLDGSRFEFEIDGHWNELGHRLVAKEIEKSAVFKSESQR